MAKLTIAQIKSNLQTDQDNIDVYIADNVTGQVTALGLKSSIEGLIASLTDLCDSLKPLP